MIYRQGILQELLTKFITSYNSHNSSVTRGIWDPRHSEASLVDFELSKQVFRSTVCEMKLSLLLRLSFSLISYLCNGESFGKKKIKNKKDICILIDRLNDI